MIFDGFPTKTESILYQKQFVIFFIASSSINSVLLWAHLNPKGNHRNKRAGERKKLKTAVVRKEDHHQLFLSCGRIRSDLLWQKVGKVFSLSVYVLMMCEERESARESALMRNIFWGVKSKISLEVLG